MNGVANSGNNLFVTMMRPFEYYMLYLWTFAFFTWMAFDKAVGQSYSYKSGSIQGDSTDVIDLVSDGDMFTCLNFFGTGVVPWYTHIAFAYAFSGSVTIEIIGMNLACDHSLFITAQPGNVSELTQSTVLGRLPKCMLDQTSEIELLQRCVYGCTCQVTACARIDLIQRPLTNQPSNWQICELEFSPCETGWGGALCDVCLEFPPASEDIMPTVLVPGSPAVNLLIETDYCGNRWIPLMKRKDGSVDFINKGWSDYKEGFGNLNGEFWLGNDYMNQLTTNGSTFRLRFDMIIQNASRTYAYTEYASITIGPESDNYRLLVGPYTGGTTGDSLFPNNQHHNQRFTTYDRDNDAFNGNCASQFKGGWWYRACHGMKFTGEYGTVGFATGIQWTAFTGDWGLYQNLNYAVMKIQTVSP